MSYLLKKIVRNESMVNDPKEIYGWRVYLLACSACFGAMSFGWDSGVIGGVITLKPFLDDYGLGDEDSPATTNLKSNIVSVLQAGCFVGAIAAYPLTDAIGRKFCLVGAACLTAIGVAMQAAASGNLAPMYVGRFIAGLGVGTSSVVNPIYVTENAPRAIRGLLTGMYQLFIVTGSLIAFWINYGVSLNLTGSKQYIIPLAVQGLPAVLLFVLMLVCNESPRYLARKDRWEEAKQVLVRIRNLPVDHPYVQEEFREIADQLAHERRLMGDATFRSLQKEMWTVRTNRYRAVLSIFLMIWQQMTGTNAINVYAPIIFQNLGLTGTSTSLFSTGIYGVVKVVSCLIFLVFMADSLGRRRSLLVSTVGQTVCMFYIGLYVRISPPQEGAAVPPAGYVALVCIFLFAGFFQFGWGPACWILISEIPTARLRPMNVAMGAATQWLFNFVVSMAVPTMLETCGESGYGTYLIFGSFGVIMFFFVWFLIPETKGLSLEKMDELFGAPPVEHSEDDDHKRDTSRVEIEEQLSGSKSV
ncbi:general substrate transporter [Xylariomycetidae sp. FL0641]|nr:general substrate transporter [Xylariomycetidae sp. FL0641]